MRTSAILVLSLAGFGFALWLARGGDPPSAADKAPTAAGATAVTAAPIAPLPRAIPAATGGGAAAVAKLDPRSEAFRSRIDDQIPTHLYAEASRCYKGGLTRDQRIDLTYRIRVANGAVTIGDLHVTESTLADVQLERCILGKLTGATWRDEQLPDLEETDDLFMRVAGFSAYLANADDSPSSEGMN